MKLNVTYAHCVKSTPGQLDREPCYKYELREIPAILESRRITYDGTRLTDHEWIAKTEDGRFECVEDTQHEAVQDLLYKLMDDSRKQSELEFLKTANTGLENKPVACPNCGGAGKVDVGELAGMRVLMDCPECSNLGDDL